MIPAVDDVEEVLLAWIRASRDRQFLLMIAGRLSGLHGWKRTHIPVAYQVIGTTVVIYFDGSERLAISDVTDISMHSTGELLVEDASEVRFTWCSEKDPVKDCEEIFGRGSWGIAFSRTDDLYTTWTAFEYSGEKLIVLRQV